MERMEAQVLHAWGGALVAEERPVPTPGPGEVLIAVDACGVGSTLVNVRDGRMATSPNAALPRVLGNEACGRVAAVGPGVSSVAVGTRVVTYMYLHCGTCRRCLLGDETMCEALGGYVGVAIDGGMAGCVVVPERNAIPVPDGVDAVTAAVAADAIATPWHALHAVAPVRPSSRVVVIGAGGGVGVHAVIIARAAGATVVAVDLGEEKLAFAREHGADVAIDGAGEDVAAAIRDATDGGADIVLDYVATRGTLQAGVAALAPYGRFVVQGVNPPGTTFDAVEPRTLLQQQITLTGGRHASRAELGTVLEELAAGRLHAAVTDVRPLADVEGIFGLLRAGALLGRAAVVPRTAEAA
jgi:propanol-preferring alcohol dehydrogenase